MFQFFQLLPTLTVVENVMLPMDFGKKIPAARGATGRSTCSSGWASATRPTSCPPRCRAGSSSAPRSPGRWPTIHRSCWPTSPPATSTPPPPHAVLELFAELNADGQTIVVVTHERDIRSIVGREVTLVDGRIVTDESAAAEVTT